MTSWSTVRCRPSWAIRTTAAARRWSERCRTPDTRRLPADLRAEIADELNVSRLEAMGDTSTVVDVAVRPQFRAIGRRFGNRTQQVAQAIQAADPHRHRPPPCRRLER